jgi:NAD(P)-dependent dehydrogenase (short-subunit alcohol dehydrogenase family)
MHGKVCLVTGATSGIGEATALGLARLGARVLVHGRNRDKCERTAQRLVAVTGNPEIETIVADLSSLDNVRALAGEVTARVPRLDVLVNNAGLMGGGGTIAPGGVDQAFVVNHLAPFLLTHLLLDALKSSAPGA